MVVTNRIAAARRTRGRLTVPDRLGYNLLKPAQEPS